ncbi:hypothetical protein NPIL_308811 [Nephila pilipes]|uniref:Uncharacterized protein n=1 Tax=Nephila pilipes TaxID=299642 RepID=A0A8X6PHV0_NEPPI|nr:hypothetical protein NPIL_308811 [Nephila pilipes]
MKSWESHQIMVRQYQSDHTLKFPHYLPQVHSHKIGNKAKNRSSCQWSRRVLKCKWSVRGERQQRPWPSAFRCWNRFPPYLASCFPASPPIRPALLARSLPRKAELQQRQVRDHHVRKGLTANGAFDFFRVSALHLFLFFDEDLSGRAVSSFVGHISIFESINSSDIDIFKLELRKD